jgi:hypothetical protein
MVLPTQFIIFKQRLISLLLLSRLHWMDDYAHVAGGSLKLKGGVLAGGVKKWSVCYSVDCNVLI